MLPNKEPKEPEVLSPFKKFHSISDYLDNTSGVWLVSLVILAIALIFVLRYTDISFNNLPESTGRSPLKSSDSVWTNIGHFITIITFITALSIWFSGIHKRWEEHLEKRLTARFYLTSAKDDAPPIMECRYAPLAHEADIRNWGQQLGLQMANNERFLFFDPNILYEPGIVSQIDGHIFKHYKVKFYLYKAPDYITKMNLKSVTWEYNFKTDKIQKIKTQSDNFSNFRTIVLS